MLAGMGTMSVRGDMMLEKLTTDSRLQAVIITGVVLIGIAWLSEKCAIDLS